MSRKFNWENLLILKTLDDFKEFVDDWIGDLPAVVIGLAYLGILIVLLFLLYLIFIKWFPIGSLIVVGIWILLEIAHKLGGGHEEHNL